VRLWFFSDCHLNRSVPWLPGPTPDNVDVIVIAGDVTERLLDRVLPWLGQHIVPRGLPVVYVPGNHDFWGTNLTFELAKARPLASSLGIHLLAEGESVALDDTRFIGATLWSDLELSPGGAWTCGMHFSGHNDHRKIKVEARYRKLLPKDYQSLHDTQLAAIEGALAQPHDGPTIVVSHHAPHERSLQNGRATDALDGMYASDLTDVIMRYRPELWLHGHVHRNRDFTVGDTRVVCNRRA